MEEQAERAVKAAGTNALPYLLDQFTRRTSRWARTLNRLAEQFHASPHVETENERISVAVFGLTALGPDMGPALPTLAKELADPGRAMAAAQIMGRYGDKALPFFREAIKSTNSAISIWLIGLSVESQGSDGPLIPKLLSDPDSEIRRKLVVALSHSPSVFGSPSAAEGLNRALYDSDAEVQIAAAAALGKLKSAARLALPSLLTLVTNSNERLAHAASNAVQLIDPPARPSRP